MSLIREGIAPVLSLLPYALILASTIADYFWLAISTAFCKVSYGSNCNCLYMHGIVFHKPDFISMLACNWGGTIATCGFILFILIDSEYFSCVWNLCMVLHNLLLNQIAL